MDALPQGSTSNWELQAKPQACIHCLLDKSLSTLALEGKLGPWCQCSFGELQCKKWCCQLGTHKLSGLCLSQWSCTCTDLRQNKEWLQNMGPLPLEVKNRAAKPHCIQAIWLLERASLHGWFGFACSSLSWLFLQASHGWFQLKLYSGCQQAFMADALSWNQGRIGILPFAPGTSMNAYWHMSDEFYFAKV